MDKNEVLAKVTEIIRDVFDNDDIVVMESTVADDVEGWDSLMHIVKATDFCPITDGIACP